MDVMRLKKEIDHQTRNGRNNIYIKVSDIIDLIEGAKQTIRGEDRIYITIEAIQQLITAYEKEDAKAINEFKERLKVDMPDYKLTRIDEYGYKFEPINEREDRERE